MSISTKTDLANTYKHFFKSRISRQVGCKTSVLTKKPIKESSSERRRLAIGEPTISPLARCSGRAAPEGRQKHHKRCHSLAWLNSLMAAVSDSPKAIGCLVPRKLCLGGRDRSVGKIKDRNIVELFPPIGELRFEHIALQPASLPGNKICILYAELFKRRLLSRQTLDKRTIVLASESPSTRHRIRYDVWLKIKTWSPVVKTKQIRLEAKRRLKIKGTLRPFSNQAVYIS